MPTAKRGSLLAVPETPVRQKYKRAYFHDNLLLSNTSTSSTFFTSSRQLKTMLAPRFSLLLAVRASGITRLERRFPILLQGRPAHSQLPCWLLSSGKE